MTFREAFRHYLNFPEGPFSDEQWRHVGYLVRGNHPNHSGPSLTVRARETDSSETINIEKSDLAYCQQTEKETKTSTGSEN